MKVRRYYDKGHDGITYDDTYIDALKAQGVATSLFDNANHEVLFTREEQEELYTQCVHMIMNNTRWVLDNLDTLVEFKVNWENYKKKPPYSTQKPKHL